MGTTADELRADLEMQRAEVSRDLEAIGDRVSPGRIMERRRIQTRRRWLDMKDRVMGTTGAMTDHMAAASPSAMAHRAEDATEGNPLAMGLLAFGAGLVVATLLPESEAERRIVQRVEPHLEDVAETAGAIARETAESVKPEAQAAAEEVKEHAKSSAKSAQGAERSATSAPVPGASPATPMPPAGGTAPPPGR